MSWSPGTVQLAPAITASLEYAAITGRNGRGCVMVTSSGNDSSAALNGLASSQHTISVGAIAKDGSVIA